jgi:hypothetical protein
MIRKGKFCVKSGGTIRWGGPNQKGTKTKQIIIKGEIIKYNNKNKVKVCSDCGERYSCYMLPIDMGLKYKQYNKKIKKDKVREIKWEISDL